MFEGLLIKRLQSESFGKAIEMIVIGLSSITSLVIIVAGVVSIATCVIK